MEYSIAQLINLVIPKERERANSFFFLLLFRFLLLGLFLLATFGIATTTSSSSSGRSSSKRVRICNEVLELLCLFKGVIGLD